MKILLKNRQRRRRLNNKKILRTAGHILSITKHETAELSILFVGDRKMAELNSAYRGIDKSTDVLSFEAGIPVKHGSADEVLGDIVINIARTESQAKEYGTTFYDELYRLLIHGTLHLLGHDHEASPSRARTMRKKETEIFNALKKMDR
ncbi:MAG: rRNA maturation RNase YbeY [Nitrospirota bacterium]|nr:rRNA maturation RNase YbeY [Nitrospirota bacterium]